MTRYLTPSKLCLLELIDLYVSDQIPIGAKRNVLSFISSQTVVPSEHDSVNLEDKYRHATSSLSSLAETLSHWPSEVPGRSTYDALLQRLWQLEGLDSLHVLFQQLSELFVPPSTPDQSEGANAQARLSKASPLGQFVRRCHVEFTRLQFGDIQALWSAFAAYRAPSYATWSSRNPGAARQLGVDQPSWAKGDISTDDAAEQLSHDYTSAEDVDTLLSFSIQHLQKLGSRIPSSLRSKLETWIASQGSGTSMQSQHLQHFLAFFENWRSGQYTMALESLHRYFDYYLKATEAGARSGDNNNYKGFYQYALLHESVLHAEFNCWSESVNAMEGCIDAGKAR